MLATRFVSKGNLFGRMKILENDCWQFTGSIADGGYGVVSAFGKRYYAHRLAWQTIKGRLIPAGMTIDHLCKNRACINPRHMEVTTRAENTMRGNAPPAVNARKIECSSGHPLTPRKDGHRICVTCDRAHRKSQREELRQSREVMS